MNSVNLIGRLTADPETDQYQENGTPTMVTRFRLALDRGPAEEAEFLSVTQPSTYWPPPAPTSSPRTISSKTRPSPPGRRQWVGPIPPDEETVPYYPPFDDREP